MILLGDCGFNFYLNKTDQKMKEEAAIYNCFFYCVRGNHEARPQDISNMELIYDENVHGEVYMESAYPHIRYFQDGGIYIIGDYKTLVIGGAYSVDKYYRLWRYNMTEKTNNPKVTGWFANEQLTMTEMADIKNKVSGQNFDLILTHTCPISIEPSDLFLESIDQNTVIKNMEIFLEEIKQSITFKVWCFGHFHQNRLERPYIEQYYTDIEDLDALIERWIKYRETEQLDWWLIKGPHFYWKDVENE